MRRDRCAVGFLPLATFGAVAVASLRAEAQPAASAEPAQRSTEFRAVEGGTEMVSGGTLLVEAYAALWLILLGFLLISWRRQARIDARVDELEKAVARSGAK
jgi:hypothetical protein